jgi:flavin reductase (DIM6/NTAB) family NADH-FMN oxidoreductase RutF
MKPGQSVADLADRLRAPLRDAATLRRAYGCFPSGVIALCALDEGVPRGMTASSFTSVSLDPPLVSLCIQSTSTTWPALRRLDRLGLSVLAEDQHQVGRALSARSSDRFDSVDWMATTQGAVFVSLATAWLDCVLVREVAAGDHLIALLRVQQLHVAQDRPPLVFHGGRFRQLAAAAPSRPEEVAGTR